MCLYRTRTLHPFSILWSDIINNINLKTTVTCACLVQLNNGKKQMQGQKKNNIEVHMIRVGNIKPMMSSLCTDKREKNLVDELNCLLWISWLTFAWDNNNFCGNIVWRFKGEIYLNFAYCFQVGAEYEWSGSFLIRNHFQVLEKTGTKFLKGHEGQRQ